MSRRLFAALSFCLAFVLPHAPAYAFGPDGHYAVCAIAYDHLTPAARREVDRLIGLDPDYEAFRDACSWADIVRNTTHKDTAPYHYVGVERGDEIVDFGDCPKEGCVLKAIVYDAARLGAPALPDAKRLEALKFLAHWIGDVHQPLHVSIEGDRGGNDIKALWRGERLSNFHRMWDSEILLDYMADRWAYLPEEKRREQLVLEMEASMPTRGLVITAVIDPVAWAQESHDYARSRDMAYEYASKDQLYAPGAHYYDRHLPYVKKRIEQAGLRLAGVLNGMFSEQ